MQLQKTSLLVYDEDSATPNFTLFSPLMHDQVYLLNMTGKVIHEWDVKGNRYGYSYLLPNGNLLASVLAPGTAEEDKEGLRLIRELDWGGNVVWQCDAPGQHHDFVRLTNGNKAYLGFARLSHEAAYRVQGGLAGTEINGEYILGDYIWKVTPGGSVAWE